MVNMINMYSNIDKFKMDNIFFQGAIKNTVIDNLKNRLADTKSP